MSKADRRVRPRRRNQIESLEARLAMTVDMIDGLLGAAISHHGIQEEEPVQVSHHAIVEEAPALSHHGLIGEAPPLNQHVESSPDFWLDPVSESVHYVEGALGEVEQSLSSAHGVTGLNGVRANYGFTGGGQTVAVIDSGIAYDHYALGGGFGSNYRVVGGWDFTGENDANPYDDGPEGSHGTHVAGIIGSSHATHQGVAPDVDLVGLRVFDDNGAGYFSWVENALQWVHNNRNAFENPITAVNLSLGTNWNSSSVPAWAMLEDEFAQLEADGIFISVSAGNSFTSYNTPGLSYPAASPYVVPVMSMDDSGVLSYFSQRHQRAIAAPGRYIYSTIPDYAGNNNGITDDWANFSGTSMAAPYVAGASVIIREAMEFVGYTNITQDTIYDHMMATADDLYDSATGLTYSRLNMQAAIDALMPTDDYGSSENDAYNLGTINALSSQSLMEMNGVISTLTDSDYFTFTAGSTGTVTLTASNGTHDFAASWQGMGGEGWTEAGGDSYTMNVVAGQQYTIALSSSGGLGYYDLSVTAESSFTYTDWGAINGQQTRTGLSIGGETWYRVVSGQAGYLTAEALFATGSVDIALYDSGMNLLSSASGQRFDHLAGSGEEFYLRVDGSSADVGIRLTNLVSVSGSTVTVGGTSGDDALAFTAGANDHTVSINGVAYAFAASTYDSFQLNGGGGTDSVTLTGTAGDDTFHLRTTSSTMAAVGLSVVASSAEVVSAYGGGGNDAAYVFDTAGNDAYNTFQNRVVMTGASWNATAWGMDRTYGYASGGEDEVNNFDTAGADMFRAWSNRSVMSGDDYSNYAQGFGKTRGYASSGLDRAYLYDGVGDDMYRTYADRVVMTGDNFYSYAQGFDYTYGYSTSGTDRVYSYDSNGDDLYRAWGDRVVMSGAGYSNLSEGFAQTFAYGSGGNDSSYSYDSAGDDVLRAYANRSVLTGDGFYNYVQDFERIYTYATTGYDLAYLYDSAGADLYRSYQDRAVMSGSGYYNYAQDFDRYYAYSSGGGDQAYLYDSTGADLYRAWSTHVVMQSNNSYSYAQGFAKTVAVSSSGYDTAVLYDSAGADHVTASGADAVMTGIGYKNDARGFDELTIDGAHGGANTLEQGAVDYAFSQIGSWS